MGELEACCLSVEQTCHHRNPSDQRDTPPLGPCTPQGSLNESLKKRKCESLALIFYEF